MKKLEYDSPSFETDLAALYNRPGFPPEIEKQAAAIIAEVRRDGDAGVGDLAVTAALQPAGDLLAAAAVAGKIVDCREFCRESGGGR